MTESRWQTIPIVLPIVSAGLYLMGVAYHQGYLSEFGIHDSLFPLAFAQALLFGFIALATVTPGPLWYAICAGVILTSTVILAVELTSRPVVKYWQSFFLTKLFKERAPNTPSEAMKYFVDKSVKILLYLFVAFLVVSSLAFGAFFSSRCGRARADEDIRFFNDPKGDSNYAILSSPLLPAPTRSWQIICGQSHCAFWLGSGSLVLRYEDIECVEMHNPTVEGKLPDKVAQRPALCTRKPLGMFGD